MRLYYGHKVGYIGFRDLLDLGQGEGPLTDGDEKMDEDEWNGQALLVVFDAESATAAVFSREVEGRVLDFRLETPGGPEGSRLVDEDTGTIWAAFTGERLDGPLAGAQLERVKSTSSFWFGWKDWYPDTAIYGLEG